MHEFNENSIKRFNRTESATWDYMKRLMQLSHAMKTLSLHSSLYSQVCTSTRKSESSAAKSKDQKTLFESVTVTHERFSFRQKFHHLFCLFSFHRSSASNIDVIERIETRILLVTLDILDFDKSIRRKSFRRKGIQDCRAEMLAKPFEN